MQKETEKNLSAIIVLFSLILVVAFSGCTSTGNTALAADSNCAESTSCGLSAEKQVETPKGPITVEKLEVYHFHRASQCSSCIAVGACAEETLKTYFPKELKSGKIVFGHINIDTPENQVLSEKYEATGSSLWIGEYPVDGKFSKEQESNIWYKIWDKKKCMEYFKEIIKNKLSGSVG